MRRVMRILKIALGIVLVGIVVGAVAVIVLDKPRPEGESGPEAEALAESVMRAADVAAWDRKVGAIEWNFGGRRDHLWDRTRHLVRVRWSGHVALLNLTDESSHITKDGELLTGDARTEARREAYEAWVNDSFWLNPIAKLKDEGTQRTIVQTEEGGKGLLITYGDGGVTPGDSYLWIIGQDGLPTAWRMWVSIIPIGGLKATWQDWQTLPGGAKVATRHEGPFTLELTDIRAAKTLSALHPDEDPFAPLFAEVPTHASSQPADSGIPAAAPAEGADAEPRPAGTPEPAAAPAPAKAPAPTKAAPTQEPEPAEEL